MFFEIVFPPSADVCRDQVEDALEEALGKNDLGAVTGAGAGTEGSNIDVELNNDQAGLACVIRVLRSMDVPAETVVYQYEPTKRAHPIY